jgi:hypothetical protein
VVQPSPLQERTGFFVSSNVTAKVSVCALFWPPEP